ncbi:TetR/AcrR family transcriptional regulator [Pseudonocardia acaciae]|uniref:TetR/AcrR family transcriptional regulator n=1 Tax=Pseudonocardia acaciae TaxID=551276 RepID=UPI00048DB7C8|nr:TetR family transcriptional regulator [Pseudonocardia acaciae]
MARPRVPLISKRKALEVALEIIDTEGIDALSIRRLADRLKVNGASLYHHFKNKDAILAGAAAVALEEVRAPRTEGEPWRVWLLRDARRLRQAFRDHPDLVPVMLSNRPLGIGAAQVDATVLLLESAQVPVGAIAPMLEALELYAVGSALHETRSAAAADRDDETAAPRLAEAAKQRALEPDEIFDLVCEKIIDTVVEAAAERGQSMPSGPADSPDRNWRTNGSSDAKASSASP